MKGIATFNTFLKYRFGLSEQVPRAPTIMVERVLNMPAAACAHDAAL